MTDVAIRRATPADGSVLRRLAVLDSAPVPAGEVLIAFVDGFPVAALELDGGRVVADPFSHTAAVVDLLRMRAAQLRGPVLRRHRLPGLLVRRATA